MSIRMQPGGATPESSSLLTNWPTLLAILLVLGGLVANRPALHSSRPKPEPTEPQYDVQIGQYPLRPWDDPYSINPLNGKASVSDHVELSDTTVGTPSALVVAVVVPGSEYSIDRETRLRTRYAVHAALHCRNYMTVEPSKIRFFAEIKELPNNAADVPWYYAPISMTPPPHFTTRYYAYEWFHRSGQDHDTFSPCVDALPDDVLVIWVRDSDLGKNPKTSVSRLIAASKLNTILNVSRIHVIGPTSSDGLVALYKEFGDGRQAAPTQTPPSDSSDCDIRFFTPWATAAYDMLVTGDPSLPPEEPKTTSVTRMVATDDTVCELLAKELRLRQVRLDKPTHQVVLITERDTAYGRAMYETYVHAEDAYFKKLQGSCGPTAWHRENIHEFTYLRGLDGDRYGVDEKRQPKQSGASTTSGENAEGIPNDWPQGYKQFDYLARLRTNLQQLNARFHREGRGEIRAVGIFGTDVHDKLTLIRAIKPYFPNAVFFSTDLDSIYWSRPERDATRNLIVASSYGLTLDEQLQRSIPPFRDNYQTATYCAMLQALGEPRLIRAGGAPLNIRPRIFEIGRNGAIDLTGPYEDGDYFPSPPPPRLRCWLTGHRSVLIGWCIFAFVFLIVPFVGPWRQFFKRLCSENAPFWILVGLLLLVGIVLPVLIRRDHVRDGGEVFSWASGVSVWLTEIIRFFTAALSAFFLILVWRQAKENSKEIEADFKLAAPGKDTPQTNEATSTWWRRLRSKLDALAILNWPFDDEWTRAADVWQAYQKQRSVAGRILRIAAYEILYFLAFLPLFIFLGVPRSPVRGDVAYWVDSAAIFVSTVLAVALLLLIMDITRLSEYFVSYLLKLKSRKLWSRTTLKAAEKRHGLRVDRLDDLSELVTIELLGRHTEALGRFIYYPFIILLLLLLSRNRLFDAWAWPLSLICVFAFITLGIVVSALLLRRSAKTAKKKELERLNARLADARYNQSGDRITQLVRIRRIARDIRYGAFQPPWESPILRGALIAPGGLGAFAMLEQLMVYISTPV